MDASDQDQPAKCWQSAGTRKPLRSAADTKAEGWSDSRRVILLSITMYLSCPYGETNVF